MRAMYHLVIVAMPEYEELDWRVLFAGGIRTPQGVPSFIVTSQIRQTAPNGVPKDKDCQSHRVKNGSTYD
jgi:hypothetical protein